MKWKFYSKETSKYTLIIGSSLLSFYSQSVHYNWRMHICKYQYIYIHYIYIHYIYIYTANADFLYQSTPRAEKLSPRSWKKTFQKSPGRNQQFGHFRAIRIHIGLGWNAEGEGGFCLFVEMLEIQLLGTLAPVHLYDYEVATRGILYDRSWVDIIHPFGLDLKTTGGTSS